MRLVIEPISAEAFAPHGTLVRAPVDIGRNAYPNALRNRRPEARAMLSASRALPKALPLIGIVMERHRFSSQTFFPLDVAHYLIVVAPQGGAGVPDMRRARALMVPGDTAITYAADSWRSSHDRARSSGLLLGAPVADGSAADMETVTLDEPFELAEG